MPIIPIPTVPHVRLYIIKNPKQQIRGKKAMLVKLGKSLPDEMKHLVLGLKNKVLDRVERYINENRTRIREKHQLNLEPWRLKTSSNLIAVLRASSSVVRTGTNRVQFFIGKESFLDKHAPYWKMLNYGGRIKSGFVPGYFGKGLQPGAVSSDTFKYTGRTKTGYAQEGSGSYGKSKIKGMVPSKPITGIRYLTVAHQTFITEGNIALKRASKAGQRAASREFAKEYADEFTIYRAMRRAVR